MNSRETIVEPLSLSVHQQQIVRETLRAILDSPHFSRSKRYPAFLEFVVSNTLAGNASLLKERVVANEVFGRLGDYDPSSDPVVRYTAGEVRKRIALYFSEHPQSPVRIDLPLGGYTAEFHFQDAGHEKISENEAQPGETPDRSAPVIAEEIPLKAKPTLKAYFRWASISLAAILLIAITAFALRNTYAQHRAKQDFWWPVLHNDSPATVVVGEGAIPNLTDHAPQTAESTPPEGNQPDFDENGLVLGNAVAVSQACNAFRNYNHACKVMPSQSAPFRDLHNSSIVLIGAFDNALTTRYLSNLRFQFRSQQAADSTVLTSRKIIDQSARDGSTPWEVGAPRPSHTIEVDYALLARFHSDLNDGMVVVIAGLGPQGTHSAGDLVSPPGTEVMREIASQAPRNWAGINFEAVLKIDIVQGSPGHISIVGTQFW